MAAKKRKPSKAARRAAETLLAPTPEMVAMATVIERLMQSVVALETTTNMLVAAMCGEARRNYALGSLRQSKKSEGT